MFSGGALVLFRVRGVPIRAHWTLLLVLPYLVFALSARFGDLADTAGVARDELTVAPWVWGIVLSLGLFASVLVHELAHVLVATRRGGQARGITLMLLGGVSQIARMPRRPRDEALVALVGPAASFALGASLIVLLSLTRGGPPDLVMAVFYLGALNIVLAVFNLLPAFPMDGGRILRALLAIRMGSVRATVAAATVGRVLAFGMALLGIATGNLLLVLIAVFVLVGAGAEASGERARAALEGLTAGDLLPHARTGGDRIGIDEGLAEALPRMREVARPALLVVDHGGGSVGVLEAADVGRLSAAQRARSTVRDLARALRSRFVVVDAAEPATEVIDRAGEAGARHVVIADPDAPDGIAGFVSSPELAAALELRLAERAGV
jgi:Zn-dependent protease